LTRYFHFPCYFHQKPSQFAASRSTTENRMRDDWNMKSYRPTFTKYLSCWYQSASQCMPSIAQSFLHVASCSKLLCTDKWTIRRSAHDKEEFWLMTICISRWSCKFTQSESYRHCTFCHTWPDTSTPRNHQSFAASRSTSENLMRNDWNMKSYRPTFTNYLSCWYQSAPQCMLSIAQSFFHVASCSKFLCTDKRTIRRSTHDREEFVANDNQNFTTELEIKPQYARMCDRKTSNHLIGSISSMKLATP
jgi:hypothetical protein